jgi:hypothetical protein
MGRPRKWNSDAERKAALRAAENGGLEPAEIGTSPAPELPPPATREPTYSLLRPDELPVVGRHAVTWGSELLNDVRWRRVQRSSHLTENQYVELQVAHSQLLVDLGLKDEPHRGEGRVDRTERYARWRYKGFLSGEIDKLQGVASL